MTIFDRHQLAHFWTYQLWIFDFLNRNQVFEAYHSLDSFAWNSLACLCDESLGEQDIFVMVLSSLRVVNDLWMQFKLFLDRLMLLWKMFLEDILNKAICNFTLSPQNQSHLVYIFNFYDTYQNDAKDHDFWNIGFFRMKLILFTFFNYETLSFLGFMNFHSLFFLHYLKFNIIKN